MAISFRDVKSAKVIVAKTREIRPEQGTLPGTVVADFARILKTYGLQKCSGDRFGAAWVTEAFQREGITLEASELNSSQLYVEMVGPLSDGKVEIPDDDRLVRQLKALQCKVVPGGADKVLSGKADRSHSDLSNAVAGAVWLADQREAPGPRLRSLFDDDDEGQPSSVDDIRARLRAAGYEREI